MLIKVAKNAGFCFGVERAVNGVINLAKINHEKSLLLYGMLIHNSYVMDKLKNLNVNIIDNINTIGKEDIVFIRSHGVTSKEYFEIEERSFKVYDFTCPFVKKIHDIVSTYSNDGYDVIIIGDDQHPEVKGIKGYVNDDKACFVVDDIESLAQILVKLKNKAIIVCQTTFDNKKWAEIKEFVSKNPDVIIFDTVCDATKKRQEEAINLSQQVDIMLVIGDKKSSNTNKLFNVLKAIKPTYFIESVNDIESIDFLNIERVGVTAGASTSEEQINEVVNYLEERFNKPDEEEFEKFVNKGLNIIKKGDLIKGKIIKVENDYLLVDIGYKSEGIVYKNEIFRNSNVNLKEIFKKDDYIECLVLKESDEEGNVVLSKLKADLKNGFDELIKRYNNNERITILIKEIRERSIVGEYRGVNVFVPISQWKEKYSDQIIGKMFEVEILAVDQDKKIAFATRKNIVKEKMDKLFLDEVNTLDLNQIYQGEILDIKDKGLIVRFKSLTGFVPIKEISYSRKKEDILRYYKIGEMVNVKILEIDKEKKQIYLSIRKTEEDKLTTNIKKLYLGMIVDVEVLKVLNFGIVVNLIQYDLEGFIHISNIPIGYNQRLYNLYKKADILKAKIIEIDEEKRRVSLTLKDLIEEDDAESTFSEDFVITLADFVDNKIKKEN